MNTDTLQRQVAARIELIAAMQARGMLATPLAEVIPQRTVVRPPHTIEANSAPPHQLYAERAGVPAHKSAGYGDRARRDESEEAMTAPNPDLQYARLVILTSPTGRDPWHPVMESEVPAWVKKPDVMGRLVAGDMCMEPTEGETGSNWYRAARVPTEH